ncbi:MAG TPA: UDP-N-acetylmuramoyl-tripeptide--D-alanyl-D-alanine ligase [Verrucomicrobiae bacterium]|jgi:UDP-N-acetylmuramoyl-tripeptide--D-alanyl-D-alanine ligase
MEPRSLQYVCAACSGELAQGSPELTVTQLSTDSRQVRPNCLFFALEGERFDAHDFLEQVAQAGAAAVVANRAKWKGRRLNCAAIVVEDTRWALGQLATRYRQDYQAVCVAVCGSNGKTTTKELLASVLGVKLKTLWSEASFNNDVGVPLTLLHLELGHQAAVLEAGTNHPGELRPLLGMIQPRIGILTSIGREHLEFFKNIEGVAREEGTVAEILPENGALIMNGDTDWADAIAERTSAKVIRAGFGDRNDWRLTKTRLDATGVDFQVSAPIERFSGEYRVNLLGRHQAGNALLAIITGAELGLSAGEIRQGLLNCQPPRMRMQSWTANGVRILDDSYNANADSMLAALQTLREMPCTGRRIAVLGDMAELGEQTSEAHREIGKRTAELGINFLIAVGHWAEETVFAARAAGLQQAEARVDIASGTAFLQTIIRSGDVILLKASRAAGFEKISQALGGTGGRNVNDDSKNN